MPIDLDAARKVALAASDAARREILPRFRSVAVETKSDGSPVTEADRAAERAIREVLAGFDPEIGVLGEEYGDDTGSRERYWVVDPIDGTIAFSRGIPLYGSIIALVEEGRSVLGLIDLPSLGERLVGTRGGGAWRGDQRLRVSEETDPRKAIICHGDLFAFDFFGERKAYERLAAELRMLRGYTDAFGHALVIQGSAGAMIDLALNPWDVAATECLVVEAGGRCVTVDRRADGRKLGLVFGNEALVEFLLERTGIA
ncbi:MAG: inositol monophosphatase family protein [Myxococcota bacterium]|nr:inositol monophosphatase family protein [Myxococcota bacterium]